jgi:hypothetical protein
LTWEDFLLDQKAVTEAQILELKAKDMGVEVVDLHDHEIKPEILNLIPEPLAHRHRIISFDKK